MRERNSSKMHCVSCSRDFLTASQQPKENTVSTPSTTIPKKDHSPSNSPSDSHEVVTNGDITSLVQNTLAHTMQVLCENMNSTTGLLETETDTQQRLEAFKLIEGCAKAMTAVQYLMKS